MLLLLSSIAVAEMPRHELCFQLRFDQPDEGQVAASIELGDPLDALCNGSIWEKRLELIDGKAARSSGSGQKITAVHVVFPPLLFAALFGGHGPGGDLPPLSWTILQQGARHVPALLAAGADPNQVDSLGLTPLYFALEDSLEDSTSLGLLLDAGADPGLLPPLTVDGIVLAMAEPRVAPHVCPEPFQFRGAKALEQAGRELDGAALDGLAACPGADPSLLGRALTRVMEAGGDELVEPLLAHGASLDEALEHGAARGATAIIDPLVALGASPDGEPTSSIVPLVAALKGGHTDTAEALVEAGADLNEVRYDATALEQLAWAGHAEGVAFLLERGARVDLGEPVHGALRKRERAPVRVDSLRVLLEAGAPITPSVELWADEHFSCQEPSLLLVDRGLEVTPERLDDLMYTCPEDAFAQVASHASTQTLRRVWVRGRKAPNGPLLRELIRERRREE